MEGAVEPVTQADIARTMQRLGLDALTARRHVEQHHQLVKLAEQQRRQAADACRARFAELLDLQNK